MAPTPPTQGERSFCAPAAAAITTTSVTTPANPSFVGVEIADTNAPFNFPVTVSGTTDPGADNTDTVDIVCVRNIGSPPGPGGETIEELASDVDVTSDAFSTTADVDVIGELNPCRILALPGAVAHAPPVDTASFTGPNRYSDVSFRAEGTAGVNAGKLIAVAQVAVTPETVATAGTLGSGCAVGNGAIDPGLTQRLVVGCLGLNQISAPFSQVDGKRLFFTAVASALYPTNPGLLGITGLQQSSVPGTGAFETAATESAVTCVPDDATCTSFADTGIRVSQTGDGTAHTATVAGTWVNTSSETRQLRIVFSLIAGTGVLAGWHFPGEAAGYHAHTGGDTLPPPASGTGSVLIGQAPGTTCATLAESCGSLTWSSPPAAIEFVTPTYALLTYNRTLPPGCSTPLAFATSVDDPQSAVDAHAAAAESALASVGSAVTCPPPAPPNTGGGSVSPPATTPAKKCKKKKGKKGKKGKKKKCGKKKKKRKK